MGSIFEVRSTGLGGAVREVKRHSKVKVPKVSHKLNKVKRKLKSHKPKDLRPKKHEKKITQKHEKMKVKVHKYDKYHDRIN